MNTETPQTDEAIYEEDTGYNGMVKVVAPDFARKLERERNALTAANASLSAELERVRAQLEKLCVVKDRACAAAVENKAEADALRTQLTEARKEADGLREALASAIDVALENKPV